MAVMMGLGSYRFSISTAAYETLGRRTEYRWSSQERIGRHPALQYIGAGHTTITLNGSIYTTFRGGLGQIDSMRAVAGQGVPHMLVSGLGRVLGLFSIMSIDESDTVFFKDGAPRKQDFAIELKSYGV
ncbi:phage tail protein [Breoghania sp.]|uniref:phage tail protein n=1 Tax=Breoghania sp. TaxID=2065378 RepID=UPI002AA62B01|nr:phage tail protein [Breoghania sp.]